MEMKIEQDQVKVRNGDPRWTSPVIFGTQFYPSAQALCRGEGVDAPTVSVAIKHNRGALAGKVRLATAEETRKAGGGVKTATTTMRIFRRANGVVTLDDGKTRPLFHEGRVYAGCEDLGRALGLEARKVNKNVVRRGKATYATEAQIRATWPDAQWVESSGHSMPVKKPPVDDDGLTVREKGDRVFVKKGGRWCLSFVAADGRVYIGPHELARDLNMTVGGVLSSVLKGRHGLRRATRAEVDAFLGQPTAATNDVVPATKFLAHAWPNRAVTVISADGEFTLTRPSLDAVPRELLEDRLCTWD